ncbi:hypothetical protein [Streptomyces sp. NEAU-H22]|uniref:hypothetical protein n=1 Tax=unclassified Streptomyces TaxID=2593676 RepID=UPI002B1CD70F|nr:hypothetical protein [Streptomyces sp. NEAU-H22]
MRIYSTPHETDMRITTLLQDRQYRTGLPGRTPPTTSRRTPASSSATARTPPPGPRSGPRSRRPARPCRPGNGSRRCRPAPDGLGCRCAGHGCRRTGSGRP